MKLIDEKGKVLGIINIVDLTIILFLISTITGFSWLIYTGELFKDQNPHKRNWVEKEIVLLISPENSEDIRLISDLRKEITIQPINITSPYVAQILNINEIKIPLNKNPNEINKQNNIELTLKLTAELRPDGHFYYNEMLPLIIDNNLQIETTHLQVTGRIVKVIK